MSAYRTPERRTGEARKIEQFSGAECRKRLGACRRSPDGETTSPARAFILGPGRVREATVFQSRNNLTATFCPLMRVRPKASMI